MLEEILAAGWEFGKPLLQAGFQRAGEQRAPGPYLQAPGVRQEAAASLYGAPQPGGGLDPKQGGDRGQQLQAAKFIIDSALSLSDKFSQKPEGGQTKGDYAKTMGVTVYGPEQTDATGQRYAMGFHPDGAQRKRYLNVGEFVDKHGAIQFGHGTGSGPGPAPGSASAPVASAPATPSSGGLSAPLDTSFNMPGPVPLEGLLSPGQLSGPSTRLPSPGGVGDVDWDFDFLQGWNEGFDMPTGMGTGS
jgi:hypothetical protein